MKSTLNLARFLIKQHNSTKETNFFHLQPSFLTFATTRLSSLPHQLLWQHLVTSTTLLQSDLSKVPHTVSIPVQSLNSLPEIEMGNLATFHRGKLFAPVSNTTFLHLELSTLISTMKTTSRYICGILYSFTLSRLIIDLLIVSSNFITDMHPAFKTVFALVVYLFGGVPARYAINSTYRWLGFHKGLQLSAASEYCKNLRFQAHYNRHHLTYLEELQHAWCLGEQEGVHCRPLYLYSLEVSHEIHMTSDLSTDEQHSVPDITSCSSCAPSS